MAARKASAGVARPRQVGLAADRLRSRTATLKAEREAASAARPRYLGLTRCSTKVQAEEGHTMADQDTRLREYAERKGWDLEMIPVPAVSGKAMSSELALALDRLARGEAAGLMVTKLDRLTRSLQVAAGIIASAQAQGWNLVLLDLGGQAVDLGTASGRLMAYLIAAFAEFEREQIVERVRAGMAAAKRNGTKTGRPIGRPRVVDPDIAVWIVEEYNNGISFQAIADGLTEAGRPSPTGRPVWQESTVRRIYNRQEAT